MNNSEYLYYFSKQRTDGNVSQKNILGGKGANLAEMTSLGLPVPPGFTLSSEVCHAFEANDFKLPDDVTRQIREAVGQVGQWLGKEFGDSKNPLLVSVRSGARVSMPGMMDTILNLGLNESSIQGLIAQSDNPRFAWDSYRRFVQMYSNVVMGMNHSMLDVAMEDYKADHNFKSDADLGADHLIEITHVFKNQIKEFTGQSFPEDPWEQLWGAVSAVFRSWHNPRAMTYRELSGIPTSWGTAVNIQSMVFGNMGEDSATGVAFTRNPSTGEKTFFGEYLINAQGEDVVAGIRTPKNLCRAEGGDESLEALMPVAYQELFEIQKKLETHYKDMQDIEFTIEKGSLWMLQTRTGKRTAKAALKIALDMNEEGLISETESLKRIDPNSLDQLLHPSLDPSFKKTILAKALPASPGGASGQVVFSSQKAVELKAQGVKTILVRTETSPEDIEGMIASEAILTSRGGMTSHAAVVARGMGKCCVVGCDEAEVSYSKLKVQIGERTICEGDEITLDGGSGEVILGSVPTIAPELGGDFKKVMLLADKIRRLGVRTNADNPEEARQAREFGAEGIGLCRTEHMFFGPNRIDAIREMILAQSSAERKQALQKLHGFQSEDFYQIFKAMDGFSVTIRLLDPPLHEFVPHTEIETEALSERIGMPLGRLKSRLDQLKEFNPMLGHRGCRLAISYPEIYEMQSKAIAEASIRAIKEGIHVLPEIMIPLINSAEELKILKTLVVTSVTSVQQEMESQFEYKVGTMIELPRAALLSHEIAPHADFFSFGTNDLTQTTLGLSRDDSAQFLKTYVSDGIFSSDPFVSIDQKAVGELVKTSVKAARNFDPEFKLGICGEHGGDPESVNFFHGIGLDYVSCSPYRVPIARLAAAQAVLKEQDL